MKSKKNKTCVDCLHCKVSAVSAKNRTLCFCAVKNRGQRRNEAYWREKRACGRFEDMSVIDIPRRPLLRKRA